MMNEEENAAYDKLPDSVPVCRGCDVAWKRGLSWSLDEEIANAFPFQTRFKANDPIVIRARHGRTVGRGLSSRTMEAHSKSMATTKF